MLQNLPQLEHLRARWRRHVRVRVQAAADDQAAAGVRPEWRAGRHRLRWGQPGEVAVDEPGWDERRAAVGAQPAGGRVAGDWPQRRQPDNARTAGERVGEHGSGRVFLGSDHVLGDVLVAQQLRPAAVRPHDEQPRRVPPAVACERPVAPVGGPRHHALAAALHRERVALAVHRRTQRRRRVAERVPADHLAVDDGGVALLVGGAAVRRHRQLAAGAVRHDVTPVQVGAHERLAGERRVAVAVVEVQVGEAGTLDQHARPSLRRVLWGREDGTTSVNHRVKIIRWNEKLDYLILPTKIILY